MKTNDNHELNTADNIVRLPTNDDKEPESAALLAAGAPADAFPRHDPVSRVHRVEFGGGPDTDVIATRRRLAKLVVDLGVMRRKVERHGADEEYLRRIAMVEAERDTLLCQIAATMDKRQSGEDSVTVGDTIEIHGVVGRVLKINKTTFTVDVGNHLDPAWVMTLKKNGYQRTLQMRAQNNSEQEAQ